MVDVVGSGQKRVDGIEKVTGAAKYVADLAPARVYPARIFRSTQAHARIKRLDVSRARKSPGVKAVVTGDSHTERFGHAIQDQTPIAYQKVRYWGEPVAVVVANTIEQAEKALELIEVEYEPLELLLNPRQSAQAGAPLLHEDLNSYKTIPQLHPEAGTNVAHHYRLRKGSVDEAFAGADHIIENEYWVPWIAHVAIEPHGGIGLWDGDTLSIWSSSQAPFFVRDTLSRMFHLAPPKVRVVVPYVGGGFGGKSDVTIEPLLGVVARSVPHLAVSLMLTREESFFGTVVGRGAWGRLKTAVSAEGELLAQEAELYFGSGGYADYSIWIAQGGGHNSTGPYRIPNVKVDSHAVYTNTPPTGAYRGYGHPEVHWMMERQMEIIARTLGMDSLQLRLKNMLKPGDANAIGQILKPYNGRPDICLTSVKEALGDPQPTDQPNRVRGQGMASFMKSPVMRSNAQSGAIVRFNDDGSVTVFTGAVELGQGASTVLAQIVAETLCLPLDKVHYASRVDTDYSPFEWQTVASHTTWAVGNAVRLAATDALNQLKNAAGKYFSQLVENIVLSGGKAYPLGRSDLAVTYKQLGVGIIQEDGSSVNPPIIGRGTFVPSGLTNPDPKTGQGNLAASWTFGSQGAEVEVDLTTGHVRLLHFVTAIDAGRIINPTTARGQVEGAVVQALGATFMEKLIFGADGRMMNSSFVDYRIPTSVDIPEHLETIFVETDDATGPYGARGIGEHGIVAVPAAVANAISNALGMDFFELPITPQMIIERLEEMKTKQRR